MKGREKALPSRKAAFIFFSLRSKTSLEGREWKGYASRTGRLDIPVRASYNILKSPLARHLEETWVSIILYGPPSPPIHIRLDRSFFQDISFSLERDLMRYFIETVFGKESGGRGWLRENRGFLEVVLKYVSRGYNPVILRESFNPQIPLVDNPLFIMGTDYDIPQRILQWLPEAEVLSLGPTSYLTSHAALASFYLSLLQGSYRC